MKNRFINFSLALWVLGMVHVANAQTKTGQDTLKHKPTTLTIAQTPGTTISTSVNTNNKTQASKGSINLIKGKAVVAGFTVSQAYPNPFDKQTSISYRIPQDGWVTIQITDLNDRVLKIWSENKSKGYQVLIWDGVDDSDNHLPAGMYFCSLQYNGRTETRKILKSN